MGVLCTFSADLIFQTVRHNRYDQDPYAQEFGIKISDRMASVEARILPPPRVIENNCTYYSEIYIIM